MGAPGRIATGSAAARRTRARRATPAAEEAERKAPAAPEERQLLEVLLAEPDLVFAAAEAAMPPEEIAHPGLRRLLEGLYALARGG